MTIRGSTAWYRRNDFARRDSIADLERRRAAARAAGEFDEITERLAFEAWFRESRRGDGATCLTIALRRHPDRPAEYEAEPTQRDWNTWQHAVGAGRLLPKHDAYKAAADRLTIPA